MKKILVPCDFSSPAIDAFRFALEVAEKSPNSTVYVLYIIEQSVIQDTVIMPVLIAEEKSLQQLKLEAKQKLESLELSHNKNLVNVVTEVKFGDIAETIEHYTRNHEIDVILMGSHGANGFKEFFMGSNAEKIVRSAPVPVLVQKHYYFGGLKNIVFPNTLETENQEELIRKVKELQDFFNAHLWIVWINTPINFTSDVITHKRLNKFAQRFQFKNYTINVFNHLTVEEGIREFANEVDAPLIAMGTHGRKGISHFLNSSVTESLVNHTHRLVWSYVMKDEPVGA